MKRKPARLPDIDAVLEGDRRFFERFPERRHRVRIAARAEVENLRAAVRRPLHLPEGCQYLTAVRHVAPGVRARVFLYATTDAPTDLPEEVAAEIFHNTLHGTGAVLDEKGHRQGSEHAQHRDKISISRLSSMRPPIDEGGSS